MSAWKRSPSGPSVTGPGGVARPEIFASPGHLSLGALDRIDRGNVQGEPRISTEIRTLARVRHRAEDPFTGLEYRPSGSGSTVRTRPVPGVADAHAGEVGGSVAIERCLASSLP
jgi:hypothetical protein